MPYLIPLFGLVLVCTLLGLLQLLSRSPRILSIPALVLGAWGVAGLLLFRSNPTWWMPSLALAGIVLMLRALRTERLHALLGNPVLQGLVFLLAGPGLLITAAAFSPEPPEFLPAPSLNKTVPVAKTRPESEMPRTDKGRLVPLYSAQDGGPDVLDEPILIRHFAETASVIRTAKADLSYNCHGWVFTGGKGWVTPQGVESILCDNDYHEVDRPSAGDLIVYYEGGEIEHTGVVRVAEADGLVLVESKWGWEGRFIHAPENQPCGNEFRYYHSDRSGHHLRNLGAESDYLPIRERSPAGQRLPVKSAASPVSAANRRGCAT